MLWCYHWLEYGYCGRGCGYLSGTAAYHPGLILGLRPANESRRYFATTSLTGWVQPRISLSSCLCDDKGQITEMIRCLMLKKYSKNSTNLSKCHTIKHECQPLISSMLANTITLCALDKALAALRVCVDYWIWVACTWLGDVFSERDIWMHVSQSVPRQMWIFYIQSTHIYSPPQSTLAMEPI